MSGPIGKLDPETHRRVFTDTVVPNSALPHTSPQAEPHAVMLAGQPGAGKGNLVLAARLEYSRNIVTIDPDAQRRHYPGVEKLRESHPYTWSAHTHYDASRWAGELRDAAVAGRRNLIIDTTLGHADGALQTVRGLQDKGYSVEIRAIATHRLESEISIDQRFTGQLDKEGFGRHVPGTFHDAAYKALPANLDKVQAETGARIRIYNREGAELYDSRATPGLKPSVALEQAREARMADPRITRGTAERAREQQDFHRRLPDILERNPRISAATEKNLPPERQAQEVVPRIERAAVETATLDRTVRVEPALARGTLAIKAAGTAAVAYDAHGTARTTSRLLEQDNLTGARSEILHFGTRNLGMAAGAALGASVGAMAGVETGPGLFVTGGIGGIVGALGGEQLANAADRARIYHQQGSDGNHWQFDPDHPRQGWTRLPRPGESGPAGPSPATGEETTASGRHVLQASARLGDELNYKASSVAVELALARAPTLKDPFRQAPERIGEAMRPGMAGAGQPWTRDPQSHAWTRETTGPATPMTHGMPVRRTVTASPEQARQLDKAAEATIADNIAHGPQAIAQRYLSAYDQNGWNQHGPVPAAVTTAARIPPTQLSASDGHAYTRGQDGQWTTPGTLYGTNTAQGQVREELDATRRQMQPPMAPHVPAPRVPPALTPQQIEAAVTPRIAPPPSRASATPSAVLPAGRMSFAEAHQRRDEPEQISAGSLRPVGKLPKVDRMQELTLARDLALVVAQDKKEFGDAPSPHETRRPSMERTQERTPLRALEPAPVQTPSEQPAVPLPPTPTRASVPVELAPQSFGAPPRADVAMPLQPVAAAEAPAHTRRAEVRMPAPQPATRSMAADESAGLHAQLAALQEQVARLTGLRSQDGPQAQRDDNRDRGTAQAASAPRTEPAAPAARAVDPRDPTHPAHQDFQKIYGVVAQSGRWDAQQSINIAAQALADFRADPMRKRLDVVSLEADNSGQLKVFAGYAPWGVQKGCPSLAVVDPVQVARVPAEQGFERLDQIGQQRAMEEAQRQHGQGWSMQGR